MKVIILAGGFGTRLGTITDSIPKPMVQIGDKPIIWHIMKIYSYYGFNEFIISLGYKGEVIKNYFYNYNMYVNDFSIDFLKRNVKFFNKNSEQNWKVILIDTGINTLKGARIKRVEQYLDSEINMVTYGDGVADIDLLKLLDFHKNHGKTLTITGVHPPARFGEVIEKDNKVVRFLEKPQTSIGLINGGFMVFNKNLLSYLSVDENCDLEIGVIDELAEKGEVMLYKHEGLWECVDSSRDLIHLNKLWNEKRAFWKVW